MEEKQKKNQEKFHPKGTLIILLLFLLTLIALWGTVYLILLQRGVTL
jgi:hypothetical protein